MKTPNDKDMTFFTMDAFAEAREKGPVIVGGEALREALEKGEYSIFHRFQWSKDERKEIRRCLDRKFKGDPVDKFMGLTAEYISGHAWMFPGPSYFKSPKKRKPPRRQDTIIQDEKDLGDICLLLMDAAAKAEALGDIGQSAFWVTLTSEPWMNTKIAFSPYGQESVGDLSKNVLKGMAGAAQKARGDIIKAHKPKLRKRADWKRREILMRRGMVEAMAKAYKSCFDAEPPITRDGVFDEFLILVFQTVGMRCIDDWRNLIKQARSRL